MSTTESAHEASTDLAPWPGTHEMPRWNTGDLIDAPKVSWRNWTQFLGPGLVAGGAAIGGGEWLVGPEVTARYGGAILWLATLSIMGQVLYNIEITRYTMYCGEPIFNGKFRTPPSPLFWLTIYLILDFGSFFPYLAANAATPAAAVWLGRMPDPEHFGGDKLLLKGIGLAIFVLCVVPLLFGGKVYNSLRAIMLVKVIVVMGFLLLLAILFSSSNTWVEIFSGFFKFGTVPVVQAEDHNNNGVLDPGEDWDGDGRLDAVEPILPPTVDRDGDGKAEAWADVDGDGRDDKFQDLDHDGIRDGDNVENIFVSLFSGRGFPLIEWSLIASLATLAAIAGNGGLTNTPISNYARDQGWGMGWHVGAIPSAFGAHNIQLSHVGMVFKPDAKAMPRWKDWYKHAARDQLCVWMPACFFGLALPSMLSVEFLKRGTAASNWTSAGMTAGGVRERVLEDSATWLGDWSATAGNVAWYMTLFCGFLVLAPSMASTADGIVRRWVDVLWTASPRLRKLSPKDIGRVYFSVLGIWMIFGIIMLTAFEPGMLVKISGQIMNFALGVSCWHVAWLNCILLPKELRPNWFIRIGLVIAGVFFGCLTVITTMKLFGYL